MKKIVLLKNIMVISFVMIFYSTSFSQEHVTVSLQNITSTENTLEYDLYIVNDGTLPLKLAGFNSGISFNAAILNGGNPGVTDSYEWIVGSCDSLLNYYFDGTTIIFNTKYIAAKLHLTQITNSILDESLAYELPVGHPVKLGRFRFTNTTNWALAQTNFTMRLLAASGITPWDIKCYVNGGTTVTSLNFANGKLNGLTPPAYTINFTSGCASTASFQTITACDNYNFFGTSLTSSGNYSHTIENGNVCGADSTINLNLTIRTTKTHVDTANIYACDKYDFFGDILTTSGYYTYVYPGGNVCGFDSTVCIKLQINKTEHTSNVTICGGSYTWHYPFTAFGEQFPTFNKSGVYTHKSFNDFGCIHTETLFLTVHEVTKTETVVTLCTPDSISWHGDTYRSGDIYQYTNYYHAPYTTQYLGNTDLNGCVIPDILKIYVGHAGIIGVNAVTGDTGIYYPSYYTTKTICVDTTDESQSLSYTWQTGDLGTGVAYTSPGVYTNHINSSGSQGGCGLENSLDLQFSIKEFVKDTITTSACLYYIYQSNPPYSPTTLLDASGMYQFDEETPCGKQTHFLNLTIGKPTRHFTYVTNCYSYTWNTLYGSNETYTRSGSYATNTLKPDGCEHTEILILTITNETTSDVTLSVCPNAFPYNWNNHTFNAPGTYTVSIPNYSGCDSIVSLTITTSSGATINYDTVENTICPNQLPYSWNGNSYAAAGIYTAQLTSTVGCDSFITLHLIVKDLQLEDIDGPTGTCTYTSATPLASTNLATYSILANGASSFNWTAPAGAFIRSGQGTNTIQVAFINTYSSGTISVTVNSLCGGSQTRIILVKKGAPVPGSILGSNQACTYLENNSAATYSIKPMPNAITYRWTLPSNVTLISASSDSLSVTIKFNNNFLSGTVAQRTIKVKAISGCGNSTDKSLIITIPTPPASKTLTGPTNVCGYMTSEMATYRCRKIAGAISYNWSVPVGAAVVFHPNGSGINDTVILVSYDDETFSGLGADTIKVRGVSGCGTGAAKNLIVKRGTLGNAGAFLGNPDAGQPKPITDVCSYIDGFFTEGPSFIEYKIHKVPGASSYKWEVSNSLGSGPIETNGVRYIIHPSVLPIDDTIIQVMFTGNIPATGTTISVQAVNECNPLGTKASILKIVKVLPKTPGTITGNNNPCTSAAQGTPYTYSIRKVPLAIAYDWNVVGADADKVLSIEHFDWGVNDTAITVIYAPNFKSGAISVRSIRTCGNSADKLLPVKTLIIAGTVISGPLSPCPLTTQIYTCKRVANASSYVWTTSIVGATITIIEDTAVAVTFPGFSVYKSGKIIVDVQSVCGGAGPKSLSIVKPLTNCRTMAQSRSAKTAKIEENNYPDFDMMVTPNPAKNNFTIFIQGLEKQPVEINIINEFGQSVYSNKTINNNGMLKIPIHHSFASGIYIVSGVSNGNKVTKKLVISR